MSVAADTWELLARALCPPAGDVHAARALGLELEDAGSFALEHARLFGRAGAARVSPYEADHRGPSYLAEAAGEPARSGWAPASHWRDRPDHAGLELAVMARLAAAGRRGRRAARQYMERRLKPWLPGFFRGLSEQADCPGHRRLARVALAFLERQGAWPAPVAKRHPPEPPCEAPCSACGRPTGIVPPAGHELEPVVCASCRIRADLRRIPR